MPSHTHVSALEPSPFSPPKRTVTPRALSNAVAAEARAGTWTLSHAPPRHDCAHTEVDDDSAEKMVRTETRGARSVAKFLLLSRRNCKAVGRQDSPPR